jgi:hypothetical protein
MGWFILLPLLCCGLPPLVFPLFGRHKDDGDLCNFSRWKLDGANLRSRQGDHQFC